ncbi:MAG: hypothetical protein AB7G28_20835 [Pirellulales bacterium]
MSKAQWFAVAIVAAGVLSTVVTPGRAATLGYSGSDYDIGGTFFPGGTPPDHPYVVVPWRSNSTPKTVDLDGNNVYGSAGYAMFGTEFQYPNAFPCCGSAVPADSATHPNLISLPSFVTASQILTPNKVGGWTYALVDPPSVNGARDFNWGQSQSPPTEFQAEYVKIGILDGNDVFGNNPKTAATGAGRWAFTVGAGVPNKFRIGVMTDGLDDTVWAATEVLLHQIGAGNSIIQTATTSSVVRNRFVDIHTFDIVGAQPGDTFAIFAKATPNPFAGNGAISAVTFDLVPEPASAGLLASLLAIGGFFTRGRRS